MDQPVILVLDNDDGLGNVVGTIKKNFGVAISAQSIDGFYHIKDNLYVVKTPETKGKSCIEDLFPEEWLKKELKGKKLNLGKINPEKEYGKEVFAKVIVKANADKIDSSGFDPLLDRIVSVLDHYSPP